MAGSPSVRRALVVEGDPALSMFYVRVLEGSGFVCEVVRGIPPDAGLYDLVVLDPFAGDESNLAPLMELRAVGCWSPVLGVTDLTSGAVVTLSPELGSVVTIGKPFKLSELRDALSRLGF